MMAGYRRFLLVGLLLASSPLLAYDGICTTAAHLNELPDFHWCRVPNSRMDSVAPLPTPKGVEGQEAVVTSWSGGIFDSRRDRLIVWGGGHGAYAGNEIYSFDVQQLQWSIVRGPTPDSQIPDGGTVETYGDGNPSSRHTYDNLIYDPLNDGLWSCDGSLWQNGWASGHAWRFNFSLGTWSDLGNCPDGSIYNESGYDPVTGSVIRQGNYGIHRFNLSSGTWTALSDSGNWNTGMVGEVDPGARKFVVVGSGEFHVLDLITNQYSSPTVGGDNSAVLRNSPGLAYDATQSGLVAWSGGTSMQLLNIDGSAYNWVAIPAAQGNLVTPTEPEARGTYGRFQYVPSMNIYILVNGVDEDVYFYRMSGEPVVTAAPPSQMTAQ
jgi:hypothetical protein